MRSLNLYFYSYSIEANLYDSTLDSPITLTSEKLYSKEEFNQLVNSCLLKAIDIYIKNKQFDESYSSHGVGIWSAVLGILLQEHDFQIYKPNFIFDYKLDLFKRKEELQQKGYYFKENESYSSGIGHWEKTKSQSEL